MNFIKKSRLIISLLIVFSISVFPISAFGSGVKVIIDNITVNFDESSGSPFVDQAYRTQVPLRKTMEMFGAQVAWDQENQVAIVEKDNIVVMVPIGVNYIIKDGDIIDTDTAAIVLDGRTYLPIRAVLEAFNAKVSWSDEAQTVVITTEADRQFLSVHFIDVGQGDSIFIDFGEYEVLIDGGVIGQGKKVSEYIRPFVNGNLDLLIATHVHADHLGGLPEIFAAYQIDKVIDSGDTYTTRTYQNYVSALNAEPNCQYMPDSNMEIDLGYGVVLKIIDTMDGDANPNNNSVIAELTYNEVNLLLIGDAERLAEEALIPYISEVNVLKVGHHGSYTSSSRAFLETAKPNYGIISAGFNNEFNHPHKSVLFNLKSVGAILYGTYLNGTIIMTTDGESLSFKATGNLNPVQ